MQTSEEPAPVASKKKPKKASKSIPKPTKSCFLMMTSPVTIYNQPGFDDTLEHIKKTNGTKIDDTTTHVFTTILSWEALVTTGHYDMLCSSAFDPKDNRNGRAIDLRALMQSIMKGEDPSWSTLEEDFQVSGPDIKFMVDGKPLHQVFIESSTAYCF